jgi:hypothetical protein
MIPQSILIGLVVAFVGYVLQQRSWRHQKYEETKQREFKECLEVIDKLSCAIDTRLEKTTAFASAVKRQTDMDQAYQEYADAVSEWMRNFSSFKSKIFVYFGWGEMLRFESKVHKKLKECGDVVRRSYNYERDGKTLSHDHREEFESIWPRIDSARYEAFLQLRELNDRVANEEYGVTQEWNNIRTRDLEKISRLYLLQRLFGIRSRFDT